MHREDVEEHVAASAAAHLRAAWKMVAEMEEKVGRTLAEQAEVITEQGNSIAGLQRSAAALTHVFTCSTDIAWSDAESVSFTFADGFRGHCQIGKANMGLFMLFILEEGGLKCTLHLKCWVLDKEDAVLRVISPPERGDFRTPPTEVSDGMAICRVTVTDQDKAAAVRPDGSIKVRMVVHLYLP